MNDTASGVYRAVVAEPSGASEVLHTYGLRAGLTLIGNDG